MAQFKVGDKVIVNPEAFKEAIKMAIDLGWPQDYLTVKTADDKIELYRLEFNVAGTVILVNGTNIAPYQGPIQDAIQPSYYKFVVKGMTIDIFDIAKAMNLPNTLFNALKYFRVKGDTSKRINDLEKAIECIKREIEYLKNE